MNYLVVVAHPDDEVLGAGATIKKLTRDGHSVDICIMCSEAKARAFRPDDNELNDDLDASSKMLGIRNSLVQFIEKAIIASNCDVVITHHPSDTNNDHMHTSMACQAAIRLFQRRAEVKPLKEFLFMEVLSSTEWSVNTSMNRFQPNTFVEVGENCLEVKINALATYRGVMRPFPHPRSAEAIKGLAAYRGAQSGTNYAEAFECTLRRL